MSSLTFGIELGHCPAVGDSPREGAAIRNFDWRDGQAKSPQYCASLGDLRSTERASGEDKNRRGRSSANDLDGGSGCGQVRHPPRSGWLDELDRLKGG